MNLLVATKNPGKFNEICVMLGDLPEVQLLSLMDLGIEEEFEEEGETFQENAIGKARFYAELSGLATVADDSGLLVDALPDELGVKTRRFGAGSEAGDAEWLEFFMNRMKDVESRKARFVCVAALVNGDEEQLFLGEVEGKITETVEAPIKPGIPLSSVFKAEGATAVFAAMSEEEKARYSHRGKAFGALRESLRQGIS